MTFGDARLEFPARKVLGILLLNKTECSKVSFRRYEKRNNFNGMDMFKEWKRGDYQKELRNRAHQEEENKVELNLPGQKGLED